MAEEVKTEDPSLRLTNDLLDRLVIARLEYDPQASIFGVNPSAIPTSFEYLTGCWKRLQTTKTQLHRRGYAVEDVAQAMPVLTKLKELLVSYAGLSLQEPSMFYQPPGLVSRSIVRGWSAYVQQESCGIPRVGPAATGPGILFTTDLPLAYSILS